MLSVHEGASPTSGKESQARCHCPSVHSVLPVSAQRAKASLYSRPWLSSRLSTPNLSSHAPLGVTNPAGTSRAGSPAKPRAPLAECVASGLGVALVLAASRIGALASAATLVLVPGPTLVLALALALTP